jgi:hypothetical protein
MNQRETVDLSKVHRFGTPIEKQAYHPQVWWEIYRLAVKETLADPGFQQQAARAHLQRTLTKIEPSTPRQASPQTQGVQISAEQARINQALGLSSEVFLKYSGEIPSRLDPTQAEVNRKLGLSDETFLQFAHR